MKRLTRIAAMAVSVLASGALLAQSAPPKPQQGSGNVTVAQNQPAPGGASSGATAPAADHGPSGATLAIVGAALGAAVLAAVASVHSTSHH